MGPIGNILEMFEPISLEEMDSVQLMNRTDTKYVFTSSRLSDLLIRASEYYRVLVIDRQRVFPYMSTYLDTDKYLFFYQHMSEKPQRFKVRYRIYESTGQSYLEVKCKTTKQRTIKWRIKNEFLQNTLDDQAVMFLRDHINGVSRQLVPTLVNRFYRITLVGLKTSERITIDYNLSFSDGANAHVELPFLAIAEVKREGFTSQSPFLGILRDMRIRKTGFSKYCVGNALLRTMPKTNILKSKLLLLKKIENEYTYVVA